MSVDRLRLPGVIGLVVAAIVLSGCAGPQDRATPRTSDSGPTGPAATTDTPTASRSVTASTPAPDVTTWPAPVVDPVVSEVIVTGLRSPWGLAFLPDGSALVSERDTALIRHVTRDGARVVRKVPGVAHGGEGGLLGLAVAPDARRDAATVVAYLTARDGNRVVRMQWDGSTLTDPTVILTGIPRARTHNGGRLRFGPDGWLYVGTGDAADRDAARDPSSLAGKVLRITLDGRPAPGNPDPASPVWSSGHRNVQGLAFDARGRLWATEFGQDTWDEINLIEPGGDYGWPRAEGRSGDAGLRDPAWQWRPAQASPSGLAIVGSTAFMAGLRGRRLWRIDLAADGTVSGTPRALFAGEWGRLRTVERAPDASLWLVTSNTDGRGDARSDDDRIVRLSFGP